MTGLLDNLSELVDYCVRLPDSDFLKRDCLGVRQFIEGNDFNGLNIVLIVKTVRDLYNRVKRIKSCVEVPKDCLLVDLFDGLDNKLLVKTGMRESVVTVKKFDICSDGNYFLSGEKVRGPENHVRFGLVDSEVLITYNADGTIKEAMKSLYRNGALLSLASSSYKNGVYDNVVFLSDV